MGQEPESSGWIWGESAGLLHWRDGVTSWAFFSLLRGARDLDTLLQQQGAAG